MGDQITYKIYQCAPVGVSRWKFQRKSSFLDVFDELLSIDWTISLRITYQNFWSHDATFCWLCCLTSVNWLPNVWRADFEHLCHVQIKVSCPVDGTAVTIEHTWLAWFGGNRMNVFVFPFFFFFCQQDQSLWRGICVSVVRMYGVISAKDSCHT